MIPARIAENAKKIFDVPDGEYSGFWQGYECQIFSPGTFAVFKTFETNKKCPYRKGERVTLKVVVTKIYLYERIT